MGRTVRTCLQQYPLILGRGTVGQAANEPWLGAFVGFSLKCLLVSNMGKNPAVLEGPPSRPGLPMMCPSPLHVPGLQLEAGAHFKCLGYTFWRCIWDPGVFGVCSAA